jgi:hypothetical protein
VLNHFLPKVKEKFNISINIMEKPGDKISFLKRSFLRVSDGLVVMPGNYINNMLELYESNFGPVRAQKVPVDGSIQVEDGSQELDARTSSIYRSLIGMLIYLSQERMDVGFVTKELASKMAKPTTVALARLKKLLGYLKATADYACKLTIPEPGVGLVAHSNHELNLESFSDSDWSGNKVHRRSTSSAVHVLNGNVLFTTSRTQRIVSLPSAEAELHSVQLMESTFRSA